MISNLYISGDSFIHKLSPAKKILILIVSGTAIFLISNLYAIACTVGFVLLAYASAGIPMKTAFLQIKPVLWLLLIIFAVQYFTHSPFIAALVVLRFFCLILLASLVTLTTRTSEMVAGIEKGLNPFAKWLPVERISLTITLCIRFIPTIQEIIRETREAQYTRGFSTNIFALAVPVIIRSLKMADQISEAIYARGFETEPYQSPKR